MKKNKGCVVPCFVCQGETQNWTRNRRLIGEEESIHSFPPLHLVGLFDWFWYYVAKCPDVLALASINGQTSSWRGNELWQISEEAVCPIRKTDGWDKEKKAEKKKQENKEVRSQTRWSKKVTKRRSGRRKRIGRISGIHSTILILFRYALAW